MSLVEHAKTELKLAGLFDKDSAYDGMLADAVLELIQVFSQQGHSGGSASLVSDLFDKLSRYQAITPLTGNDDEWTEVSDGVFQNRRMSNIFKQKDRFEGKAYTLDGRIFSDDGGRTWFTNSNSLVVIDFPYSFKEPEQVILESSDKTT